MTKSLNRSQFGGNAEKYVTSAVHAGGASLEALVAAVAPQADWRVLDVATAAGHTAFAFSPHVAQVVASDLTPRMLEVAADEARSRGLANVSFRAADAEALPFDDATFDAVTCRIAAHHFPHVDVFLSEVKRVLKPGGVLGLVDNVAPDVRSTPGLTSDELARGATEYNAFETLRDPSHHRALQFTEWLAALDDAGFAVGHHELLAKPMAFQPWAERLNASADDIVTLRRMIDEGSSVLRAYLQPDARDDGLWFNLTEMVLVAETPDVRND